LELANTPLGRAAITPFATTQTDFPILRASKGASQPGSPLWASFILLALARAVLTTALGRSSQIDLHLAEFQRPSRPGSPFGLAIGGNTPAPVICSSGVLVLSLQQQCKVEHDIGVVRRDLQRYAQAFNGGFNAALLIQQGAKIVPSIRECRIDARCRSQLPLRLRHCGHSPARGFQG